MQFAPQFLMLNNHETHFNDITKHFTTSHFFLQCLIYSSKVTNVTFVKGDLLHYSVWCFNHFHGSMLSTVWKAFESIPDHHFLYSHMLIFFCTWYKINSFWVQLVFIWYSWLHFKGLLYKAIRQSWMSAAKFGISCYDFKSCHDDHYSYFVLWIALLHPATSCFMWKD